MAAQPVLNIYVAVIHKLQCVKVGCKQLYERILLDIANHDMVTIIVWSSDIVVYNWLS